jgi:hypothetical protein
VTAKIMLEWAGLTAAQTRDVHCDYDLRGLQIRARFDSPTGGERVTRAYDGFGCSADAREWRRLAGELQLGRCRLALEPGERRQGGRRPI